MNKGLELIEAHHLFGLSPDNLNAIVHPQSVVHALITFRDGSIHAELGPVHVVVAVGCCSSIYKVIIVEPQVVSIVAH